MKFKVSSLACPRCNAASDVDATVIVDPGVHTFSNGDPGYPGSVEVEMATDACSSCGAVWTDDELSTLWDAAAGAESPESNDDVDGFRDYDEGDR